MGFDGPTCDIELGADGARLRLLPAHHQAVMHFVYGIKGRPERAVLDGRPLNAPLDQYQQSLLLDGSSQALMAELCEQLELSPPWHVAPGSLKCPMLVLKRHQVSAGGAWPLPADDVLSTLREIGLGAETARLVGVHEDLSTGEQSISWLAASAHANVQAQGSTTQLRAEAEWYEHVALEANSAAAAASSGLRCWQTSSAYIWMEAIDEAVSGTAGCVLSGALLTAATLLLFTGKANTLTRPSAGSPLLTSCHFTRTPTHTLPMLLTRQRSLARRFSSQAPSASPSAHSSAC